MKYLIDKLGPRRAGIGNFLLALITTGFAFSAMRRIEQGEIIDAKDLFPLMIPVFAAVRYNEGPEIEISTGQYATDMREHNGVFGDAMFLFSFIVLCASWFVLLVPAPAAPEKLVNA